MTAPTVAVVGAGIAGLTAAIALSDRGADVTVIERAPDLAALGAGIQLSPNASILLDRLGVLADVMRAWHEPDAIRLVSGTTLSPLAAVPAGDAARARWGAPYGVVRRAVLQDALLRQAQRRNCRIVLGQSVSDTEPAALRASCAAIVGQPVRLIVGADGVWSAVRRTVSGAGAARFSGYLAWRLVVDAAMTAGFVDPRGTTAFLGPSTHLVAYPLGDRQTTNLVAIAPGPAASPPASRNAPVPSAQDALTPAFARWHPRIRQLLSVAREDVPWPLFSVSDGAWTQADDIVLIGDAAHAMMPFAAQGAAQAIEDACALAEAFGPSGEGWASNAPLFVAQRKARIARVRRRTAFNRFAYHARGPVRLARDVVFATRSPERLAADLDWLYGTRPAE